MGYGLVEEADGQLVALAWGVLSASPRLPLGERLHRLHQELEELLSRWQPGEMAVEEPFVAKNARTAMAVGQAQGVALLAAASRGIPASRYSPAQVKNAVTGYGRGSKEQVQQAVRLHLGLELPLPQEDAADALAVALCHLRSRAIRTLLAQG